MGIVMRLQLIFIGMLVLAGCAALESKSRLEQFDNLARGYAKALAWSDFAVAYSATKAALEVPLPAAALKDIKITSYEPVSPLVEQDGKIIKRAARIRYVHISRMAERSLTMEEEWRYSDEASRWFLYSGFPEFK